LIAKGPEARVDEERLATSTELPKERKRSAEAAL
jgi:hypothetical protein